MAPSKADYCCGHWVDAALNVLGDRFASGWEDPWKEFRYGSDCSGLDAPYWALQMLTKAVEENIFCRCCAPSNFKLFLYNIIV